MVETDVIPNYLIVVKNISLDNRQKYVEIEEVLEVFKSETALLRCY